MKWLLSQGAGSLSKTWLVGLTSLFSLFSKCISLFSSLAVIKLCDMAKALTLCRSPEAVCVVVHRDSFNPLLLPNILCLLSEWPRQHGQRNGCGLSSDKGDKGEVLKEHVTSTPLHLPHTHEVTEG